jgi:hypothetical protein
VNQAVATLTDGKVAVIEITHPDSGQRLTIEMDEAFAMELLSWASDVIARGISQDICAAKPIAAKDRELLREWTEAALAEEEAVAHAKNETQESCRPPLYAVH